MKRRKFCKKTLQVTTGVALASSFPMLSQAKDQDEEKKKKHAKYIFKFSSPYKTSEFLTAPHAHVEIKELIEKHSKGKIYVEIHDEGKNGIGTALSNHVKHGLSQGALLSVSNLTPMVGQFDVLNIPFWSANHESYVKLTNSKLWEKYVLDHVTKNRIKVLFHYVVGARTATSTKKFNKIIKDPADFVGIKFRIPGSASLKNFYQLTKAKPMKVAWKNTAKTAEAGRFDALDPSIPGLFSGPGGLRHSLGKISEIQSVHDGWVAIGNVEFIESLDAKTRTQFFDAIEEIKIKQLSAFLNSKKYCSDEFKKLGVEIYTPNESERKALADAFGHTHPSWSPIKKNLLGPDGEKVFDQLYSVANT